MKKKNVIVWVMMVLFVVSPMRADILLFDINLQENWSTSYTITKLDFTVGYVVDEVMPHDVLFWEASPEDIGSTLNIYEATDPEGFNIMASLLTNGINDLFYYCGGSGQADYDFDLSDGTSDFVDFDITRFGLFVHDIIITENGLTTIFSNVSFQAWGIPEPTTLLLLGLGAVMVRRKQNKK